MPEETRLCELSVRQPGEELSLAERIPLSLWFAMTYPFVLTVIYFIFMNGRDTGIQNTVFSSLKLIQFAFPAVFVFLVCRESIELPVWKKPAMRLGVVFGILILVAALGLYFGLLKGTRHLICTLNRRCWGKWKALDWQVPEPMRPLLFFYSVIHSGMEEYYWRWFVYKRLAKSVPDCLAICFSSIGFMAHHVVIMVVFFGLTSPLAYLFSIGVAVGGAFWAWLYGRSGNFMAVWLSHAIVDTALFIIGYDLIF